MRFARFIRWLFLLASSGILLQVSAGCPKINPGQAAINSALSSGFQTLINGVIGLYIKAGTNQWLHV